VGVRGREACASVTAADPHLLAEPVIGPATSGRTRWLAPPPFRGRKESHFTGATATAMVQTSLLRLMISRLSFGPM
jgi:hypothetical protein